MIWKKIITVSFNGGKLRFDKWGIYEDYLGL